MYRDQGSMQAVSHIASFKVNIFLGTLMLHHMTQLSSKIVNLDVQLVDNTDDVLYNIDDIDGHHFPVGVSC